MGVSRHGVELGNQGRRFVLVGGLALEVPYWINQDFGLTTVADRRADSRLWCRTERMQVAKRTSAISTEANVPFGCLG